MKTKIQLVIATVVAVMAACCLGGCKPNADLYEYAGSDHLMVMTGNIKSVLDNANCVVGRDGIELSAPLQRLMGYVNSSDRKSFNSFLSIKGIDLENSILVVSQNADLAFAVKISDEKRFKEFVKDSSGNKLQLQEENGISYYRLDPTTSIFIRNNIACLLYSERNTVDVEYFQGYLASVKAAPLTPWQQIALAEGKTLNMIASIRDVCQLIEEETHFNMLNSPQIALSYDIEQLKSGYVKINSSLKGLNLTTSLQLVDDEGKAIESKFVNDKVDTSLLKYANDKDMLVAMAAMPQDIDWHNAVNDMIEMMGGYANIDMSEKTVSMLIAILGNLDGSVMIAAGPDRLLNLDRLGGWHAVVAAEMKEGRAQKYVEMLKNAVDSLNQRAAAMAQSYQEMGWPESDPKLFGVTYDQDKLRVDIPDQGEVYAEAINNTFIASLGPISDKGGCSIKAGDFKDLCAGFIINIPKDNPLNTVAALPFGTNVSYLSDGERVVFKAEQTDTDGLLLNNIFEFIAGTAR